MKGKDSWVAKEDLGVIGYALESSRSCFDRGSGDIPKCGGRRETLSKSVPEWTGARSWEMIPVRSPRNLNILFLVGVFEQASHFSAPSLSSAALSKLA